MEKAAQEDANTLLQRYGERAYISAEVVADPSYDETKPEVDLVFRIKENEKVFIGRIVFEGRDRIPGEDRGNIRTREEVFRREFTRVGFVPGEEYNSANLRKAINRLHDRGNNM